MPAICVTHLVRAQNELSAFRDFIESYRLHFPAMPHVLVIVFKGFDAASDLVPFEDILKGLPHHSLTIPDEGFDITAYFKAAEAFEYEYHLFLNSFSVIQDAEWLSKYYEYARRPDVGTVGATGSWQSLYSGVRFKWGRPSAYDAVMSDLEGELHRGLPVLFELSKELRSQIDCSPLPQRWAKLAYYYGLVAPYYFAVNYTRASCERLRELRLYPRTQFDSFPAPHLRTNAFMIRRDVMLRLKRWNMTRKVDAFRFESGKGSMSNQILRMGLKILVVGRDGHAYLPDEWPNSETFRQGSQRNLLVSDNHTRSYENADSLQRQVLSRLAWGNQAVPAVK